jgi:hypothetical protein
MHCCAAADIFEFGSPQPRTTLSTRFYSHPSLARGQLSQRPAFACTELQYIKRMLGLSVILATLYCIGFTTAEETHTKCISTFTSYTSSPFETLWMENIQNWQSSVCDHITKTEVSWWIGNATTTLADNAASAVISDSAVPPHRPWAWMFPVFTYKKLCVHKTDGNIMTEFVHIPIEPTAAFGLDPRKVRL